MRKVQPANEYASGIYQEQAGRLWVWPKVRRSHGIDSSRATRKSEAGEKTGKLRGSNRLDRT